MAKKTTPGKGGAKGMHKGHDYKETCKCIVCKQKRKKLVQPADQIKFPDPEIITPTFERKNTNNEYVIEITYPGISKVEHKCLYNEEKKTVCIEIAGKYKKNFSVPDVDITYPFVPNITGDVLTILIPRNNPPLSAETINHYSTGVEKEIKHEEKADQEKLETVKQLNEETKVEKVLTGEISITEQTYGVMNSHGQKLANVFQLEKGFDHSKFINDLTNRAIVFFCNNLK